MKMLRAMVMALLLGSLPMVALADGAKIIKVLPHLLDKNGKNSVAPSLFERDAYQAHLRLHPQDVYGVRYDVQWRNRQSHETTLKLRLQIRSDNTKNSTPTLIETEVKPTRYWSRWSSISIPVDTYKKLGHVISWKVELLSGEEVIAQQSSFLW